ncbi:hypothetical protein VOLCADRAFT_89533 [Volvox carteri f. nagariensis]|uniref:Uncharacterized protein n=1 Tax=Volvox carteri f. nagariensis TaxID=3068 RepID=D8TS34_VOLCA|nr:uncharacterized protein VOLCADRAFT_89533 [Volvox carteri f. nagariensis]EFJ49756.1 hypothetical protein VOLCADRAFT_89533 [Volvox carteri f. nagariensis]|eukprot:XP_002949263.1 hypothetical protein VOLCADRAFT_89533 [Volvox carteri f. nagariensis]
MGNQASSAGNLLSAGSHKLSFALKTGDAELEIVAKGPNGRDWEPRIKIPVTEVCIDLVLGGSSQLTVSGRRAVTSLSAATDGKKVSVPLLTVTKEFTLREHEGGLFSERRGAGDGGDPSLQPQQQQQPLSGPSQECSWNRQSTTATTTTSEWRRVNEYLEMRVSATFAAAVRAGSKLSWKGFWTRVQVVREFLEAEAEVQMCLEVRWRQSPTVMRELLLRYYHREVPLPPRVEPPAHPQLPQQRRMSAPLWGDPGQLGRAATLMREDRLRTEEDPDRRRVGEAVDVGLMAAVWPRVAAAAYLGRVQVEGSVKLLTVTRGTSSGWSSRWCVFNSTDWSVGGRVGFHQYGLGVWRKGEAKKATPRGGQADTWLR